MKPSRIIVVDDEPITRLDLKEILECEGFEVAAEGRNGEEAIQLAHRWHPDLIVMDIKMPVMDGIKSAQIVRKTVGCAVLLLTAFSQKELVQQAMEAGVIAYLIKPVTGENLIPAVKIALNQYHHYRSLQQDLAQANKKLEDRKQIEITKGKVMAKLGLTEQEAYDWLRKKSMNQGIPMEEYAKHFQMTSE
jgi:AmiR/NasT family two-component response regulator